MLGLLELGRFAAGALRDGALSGILRPREVCLDGPPNGEGRGRRLRRPLDECSHLTARVPSPLHGTGLVIRAALAELLVGALEGPEGAGEIPCDLTLLAEGVRDVSGASFGLEARSDEISELGEGGGGSGRGRGHDRSLSTRFTSGPDG